MNDPTTTALAIELGQSLLARGWQVTTAESCTGGGIAQAITAVAGSSQWFEQGFVTYSNRAKHQQLQVAETSLQEFGAVSSQVVTAMVKGALTQACADIAVAVSGIAGPCGGSEDKPVGTVWIAWADSRQPSSQCFHFKGDRSEVRQQTVVAALQGLIQRLNKNTV